MERELSKTPPVPALSGAVIDLLTSLCFGIQDPLVKPAEAALIFGVRDPLCQRMCVDRARFVYRTCKVRTFYITGGVPSADTSIAESRQIHERLIPSGFCSDAKCKCEGHSKNTRENVVEALKLGAGLHAELIFIARFHHCGRCRLTLDKFAPTVTMRQSGYVYVLEEDPWAFSPSAWHNSNVYRSRVWGEFLRIEKYGMRGDIAYPEAVQAQVRRIRELTGTVAGS